MDKTIEEMVEALDVEIDKISNHKVVKRAEAMLATRQRLQSARRALMGAGNKLTGEGGDRLTQTEVVNWFRAAPPDESYAVGSIAADMHQNEATIRGHLNRGKGERFTKHDDGTWSLRDPKNEVTEDDEDDE